MTKLSVNINKIATLRNARGGQIPNVLEAAIRIQQFGADGITVHPRPDERHITYADVRAIAKNIKTEFNIEGNPMESKFVDLVLEVKPHQVTLVPDSQSQLTSNFGWDTQTHQDYLQKTVQLFKQAGIRVSIFIDPDCDMITHAQKTQTDRIELYTESYASMYKHDREQAIKPYVLAALRAQELGLGINAGHDLSLNNLAFFAAQIPFLNEVSIGHALISDALYLGMENTVQLYKRCLKPLNP
ncbi:MAG: pyridoxine 5'-phosphate synthase [Chitinophagaceae bacterium]